jgi:hypothetical protein
LIKLGETRHGMNASPPICGVAGFKRNLGMADLIVTIQAKRAPMIIFSAAGIIGIVRFQSLPHDRMNDTSVGEYPLNLNDIEVHMGIAFNPLS